MSTATMKQAYQGALSATTTTTLYPVPALTKFLVKEVVLCNTDTVARTVTMQWGGGTGAANRWLSALTLQPGETRTFGFNKVLDAAETITGGASSASVVSCAISGVELA